MTGTATAVRGQRKTEGGRDGGKDEEIEELIEEGMRQRKKRRETVSKKCPMTYINSHK